ncbi:hypothetical protein [Chitinophaga nivalis]|uniref:Secreted protein n=1 Tax=Chitinophaga nivalis TaxID=2991709 RepID=A0ABT3IHR7_9BACT|nr:hypothetical protein [Chitinophaga nivalis]MCW3466838.1 hypothetical protein [Chitinophaga nivalis]MCW3483471.1 hypothetical protein [Chitinophaga nivalis]
MKKIRFFLLLSAMTWLSGQAGAQVLRSVAVAPVVADMHRCGPWFVVQKYLGANVSSMTLSDGGGYSHTVNNPVFPYTFPQGGSGTYQLSIQFTATATGYLGVSVGADPTTISCIPFRQAYSTSVTFAAGTCEQYSLVLDRACLN